MTAWPPPPDPAVYHGPAGEFVARTEPHTESDPMALLAQFLVAFGAAAGRGAHYQVEASLHYPNEFVVLVGATGKGRKGSSWDHIESLLHHVDETFVEDCIASGMSSGEGLIAEVKDSDGDVGVHDKRRLVLETEFAQVLKVLSREGNTLSPVIRNAWDAKTLRTLVKTAPIRATGAHIAIVGHITKDELLRHINATELANGFFNRFMLIAVQRSKELPFGGLLAGDSLVVVRQAVRDALRFAKAPRSVTFGPEARKLWIEAYSGLSRGQAGMFGASTARAEAHTVRLALL
ncbi:MAG: YfjI family protein [Actinomycetota bacterium]|nr:YfjI family protein [Actinomycetota bacterium]MDQ6944799.1 YfjI family protein [Actinomycetota bacterium]